MINLLAFFITGIGLLCTFLNANAQTCTTTIGDHDNQIILSCDWGTPSSIIESVSEFQIVYTSPNGKRISSYGNWNFGWFFTGTENNDWTFTVSVDTVLNTLTINATRVEGTISGHSFLLGGQIILIEEDIPRKAEVTPSSDIFTLNMNPSQRPQLTFSSKENQSMVIQILNSNGNIVQVRTINPGRSKISLDNYPDGLYYIVPEKTKRFQSLKWVKSEDR